MQLGLKKRKIEVRSFRKQAQLSRGLCVGEGGGRYSKEYSIWKHFEGEIDVKLFA